MFAGSCVALVTPMTATGEIDENTFSRLIEWHVAQGTAAIVVAGTTGEAATLNLKEQQRLISLAVSVARKRIPIIAGTGTNATASTIAHTQAAEELGADGCLIVTPYYNRPTQNGLIQHFTAVANTVSVPIVLYNVPTRTGCDLLPETAAILSEIPHIIGIKEATGNLARLRALAEKCQPGFLFYSGDDPTSCEFIRQGGNGVISITANVVPALMAKMCRFALAKDDEKAIALDKTLSLLHQALIVESNPIPVKWALRYLEQIPTGLLRLPLTPLSLAHQEKVKKALQFAGIYARQATF